MRDTEIKSADTKTTCAKGFCTRSTYIKTSYGKIICIESTDIGDIRSQGTYIGNTFAGEACIKNRFIRVVYIENVGIGDISIGHIDNVDDMECLEIYLQLSLILEVR